MTTIRMAALGAALAIVAAGMVWADTIYFIDGSSLDGKVKRETRSRVVLELPGGRMSFPAADIEHIEENDRTGVPNEHPEAPVDTPEEAPPAPALPALTEEGEQTLRGMLHDLLSAEPAIRDGARDRITRFGIEHDIIPFLERALPYVTDRQAVEVMEVVAALDPVRAQPILLKATSSALEKNRAKALELLGTSPGGGRQDLDTLRLFARGTIDPSLDVRLAAIEALEQSKDQRATPVLVQGLEHADRRVQSASLKALRALWQPAESFENVETPAQWRTLLEISSEEIRRSLDPSTLAPLVESPAPGDEDYNLAIK